jgi:putative hydrolase of HD superfamily
MDGDERVQATSAVAAALDGDLGDRVAFLLEADRLKDVERRNRITGSGRRERTAEHSWHFALAATVLAPLADAPVDVERVVLMGLVHDLVEVDAGDTFVYDDAAQVEKAAREQACADRLYALVPEGSVLRRVWEEYEHGDSAEARFARAVDRVLPVVLNHATGGTSWREHGITADRVLAVNRRIADGSARLWSLVEALVADAVERGLLAPGAES